MLYIPKFKLILMENPKCGSTTMIDVLLRYCNDNKIYYILTKSVGLWKNPDDYNYRHCNLNGIINFCKDYSINISSLIILLVIRDPIKRYLSAINFYKKILNIDKKNFINHTYYKNLFIYDNFINKNLDLDNLHLLRLENINVEYNRLSNIYNLPKVKITQKLNNRIYKNTIELS